MKKVLFWLMAFTFCTGLFVISCGDDDSSSSSDSDTDTDGDSDTDTDSDSDSDSDETCEYEDSLRCLGDMIQTCSNGVWVDFQDCTLTGQYCEMQGLFAVCVDDPPDTDTDTSDGSYYGSCNDIQHSGICFDYLGSAYSSPENLVELTCPTIDPTTVYQDELCGTDGDNFVGHCEYNASVGDPTTAMIANFYTPIYDTSTSDAEDFCNKILVGTWHAAQ